MFGDADASTPALATANSGSVATTGSFTPPNQSVLIVVDWHDTASGNTTNTSAISDSLGTLTWHQTEVQNKADPGGQNGRISLNWATVGTGTSMTVTTTGTNCAGACGVYTRVITGADTGTPIDVAVGVSNASGVISVTFAIVTTGARAFVANVDWNVAAIPTPNTGITTVVGTGIGGGPDIRAWYASKDVTSNASDSVTMDSTAPTSGNTNNTIGWALRPSTAVAETNYAGPWTGLTPGYQSPTGWLTAFPYDTTAGQTFASSLAGASTSSGALTKQDQKALTAASASSGALAKAAAKPLAASSASSGTVAKTAAKALTAASATTGALARQAAKALAGAAAAAGALAKQAGKALAGASGSSAALSMTRVILRSFAGSSTPAGALARLVGKALAGPSTPAGALSASGGAGDVRATSAAAVTAEHTSTPAVLDRRTSTTAVTAKRTSDGGVS